MVIEFLELVPDLVFYTMLGVSTAVYVFYKFFKYLIPLSPFTIVIGPVLIIIIMGSSWGVGFAAHREYVKVKQLEMQIKIADAEKRAAIASGHIEIVYRDRVKTVKDVQVVVQEKIKEIHDTIDKDCKLTPEAIMIHNMSSENKVIHK